MIHTLKHRRQTAIFRGLPGLAKYKIHGNVFLLLKFEMSTDGGLQISLTIGWNWEMIRVWKLQSETIMLKKLYYKNSIWLSVITHYYFHMTIPCPDLAILSDRNNFNLCKSTPQSQDCKIKTETEILIMEMNTKPSEILWHYLIIVKGLKWIIDFYWITWPWKLFGEATHFL